MQLLIISINSHAMGECFAVLISFKLKLIGGMLAQGSEVDVRIKWPNDIYAHGLKLAGILCQSAYRNQRFQVVIGIGLNLSNRQPTTCVDALIEEKHREMGLEGAPQAVQPEVCLVLRSTETLCSP